ncbi:MAG TPA: Gfo/Idh/MocA family oxidoreductase [archaeon]|nr:Gfo/Idh/MocA family oxidoreductase [archaeon]
MIGVGARGQFLMNFMREIEGVEIVRVCDAYTTRVSQAISRTGGRATAVKHYREMLDDKSIDVVFVATPDHWHATMAIDAVNAGKDVYFEKPLTYTVDEGPDIIKAVKKSGRIFTVGSTWITAAVQRKAREIIRSGKLGQITMIRAFYNRNSADGAWIYPIPDDADKKTVNWDMFLGAAPKVPFSLERFFRWRCYRDYSGGIPTDLFVHLCTSIHWLMDVQAPSRVSGMGALYRWKESRDVPDTVNASLEYKEGFMVNLSSTFNNQMAGGYGVQILGTEGSLILDGEKKLIFVPEPVESTRDNESRMIDGEDEYIATGKDRTLIHMENFFNCVRTRSHPEEDVEEGHRAAAVAHMVNRSIETHCEVEWDFENQRIKA